MATDDHHLTSSGTRSDYDVCEGSSVQVRRGLLSPRTQSQPMPFRIESASGVVSQYAHGGPVGWRACSPRSLEASRIDLPGLQGFLEPLRTHSRDRSGADATHPATRT